MYLKILESENSTLCNAQIFSSYNLARNIQNPILSEEENLIAKKFTDEEIEEISKLANLYYSDIANTRDAYVEALIGTMSTCRWPKEIIKYGFDNIPQNYKTQIQECMNEWEIANNKKIAFKNVGDFNWWTKSKWTMHVYIVLRIEGKSLNGNLGLTSLGTIGNPFLSLDIGALNKLSQNYQKHTIRHELGHFIGLQHEFDRPDRDSYVVWSLNVSGSWDNISVNAFGRFFVSKHGSFDYNSVMNYSGRYCRKNADGSAGALITFKDIENISQGDKDAVKFLYMFQ